MGRKRAMGEGGDEEEQQTWMANVPPPPVFAGVPPPGLPQGFGVPPPGLPPALAALPGLASLPNLQLPGGFGGGFPGGFPNMPPGLTMPPMGGGPQGPGGFNFPMPPPGMPGLPPPPPPGMGGGGPGGMDGEVFAQMRFQQVAAEYEQMKHQGIRPEIAEFQEYFGIDDRAARQLDDEMKKRTATFECDMQALYIGLEGAKNPSGMLMIRLKDMRMGNFRGMSALSGKVQEFAKKHRLDTQAAVKLGEVLDKREDPDGDMAKIGKHLERSNKPSSLMMMLLRDLREGKNVKDPEYAAAVGSKVHEKEVKTTLHKSRSRGRGGRGGRDEGQGAARGGRDRSRSRRGAERHRSRSRRGDRGGGDRGERGGAPAGDRPGGGDRGGERGGERGGDRERRGGSSGGGGGGERGGGERPPR